MIDDRPFLLLYDEECPVCRAAVRGILHLARSDRLRPVGLRTPLADRLLREEPPAVRIQAFHLIAPDGRHWMGALALPSLLEQLRFLSPAASLLRRSPLAFRAADTAYRWVSRNRGRLARFLPRSWGRPLEPSEGPV